MFEKALISFLFLSSLSFPIYNASSQPIFPTEKNEHIASLEKIYIDDLLSSYASTISFQVNSSNYYYRLISQNVDQTYSSSTSLLTIQGFTESFCCQIYNNYDSIDLFFYYCDSVFFTSTQSMEQARKNAFYSQLQEEEITEEQYIENIGASSSFFLEGGQIVSTQLEATNLNKIDLSLHLTLENRFGIESDLTNIRVELFGKHPMFDANLGYGFTDSFGVVHLETDLSMYFQSYAYESFYIHLESYTNYSIIIDENGCLYEKNLTIGNRSIIGNHLDASLCIDMHDDFGKSLQVCSMINYCTKYAMFMTNQSFLALVLVHVDVGLTESFRYNSSGIHISLNRYYEYDDGVVYGYEDWDTICHEYGHHVQHLFPNLDNSPGAPHVVGVNCIDYLINRRGYTPEEAKTVGSLLSWSEAWATYFGQCVQEHFSSIIGDLYGVADQLYRSSNGAAFFLDEVGVDNQVYGDTDECAIAQILYQLTYDNNFLGLSEKERYLFSLINSSPTYVFGDFYNKLNAMENNSLNLWLHNFSITPVISQAVVNTASNLPMLVSWEYESGSNYFGANNYTLSLFKVYHSPNNPLQLLYTTTVNTKTAVIPKSIWQPLVGSTDTFYLQVKANLSYDETDVSYYSTLFTLNI